jgi:spindle assembly abnormal protein 6
MAVDLHREAPLFDDTLSVEIISSSHESRTLPLVVRLLSGTRQHVSGAIEKIIHFEVTDDTDAYFLYALDVGEQDFHGLKRDQSILVDFNVFPTMFIELLNQCTTVASYIPDNSANSGSSGEAESGSSKPKNDTSANNNTSPNHNQFMLRLDEASGYLSVLEINTFNSFSHISLQLRNGK